MRFLILPKPSETEGAPKGSGALDEKVFTAYMAFNEEMARAGVLLAAEGLNPAGAHARVTLSRGKRTLVDGPFTETKELLGGFYLIEVKSKDEAIDWARRCPVGLGGDEVLEIHQMTELSDLPPRLREIIGAVAPTWSAKLWR